MAFIVFKHKNSLWRKKTAMSLRKIKDFEIFGIKRQIRSEKYIRKSRVIIIQGGYATGKSRELEKIFNNCEQLFGEKGIYIPVGESFENWYKRAGIEKEELKNLRQFEKNGLLIDKVKKKILFLDDVDRAKDSKVKIDVIKYMLRAARAVVLTCRDVEKLHEAIKQEIRYKLKLKFSDNLKDYVYDLGDNEVEIKDIGMVVAIIMIVFIGLTWGLTESLLGALALRYIANEGRKQ